MTHGGTSRPVPRTDSHGPRTDGQSRTTDTGSLGPRTVVLGPRLSLVLLGPRLSSVLGPLLSCTARTEAVAEGLLYGRVCCDALGRAAHRRATPTGDRPTNTKRVKQCTEGARRRWSNSVRQVYSVGAGSGVPRTVYGGSAARCTTDGVRREYGRCTAGCSDGVRQGVRQAAVTVYGRCTAGCRWSVRIDGVRQGVAGRCTDGVQQVYAVRCTPEYGAGSG